MSVQGDQEFQEHLKSSMAIGATIYVALIDWGTIDGYPNGWRLEGVYDSQEKADAAVEADKTRTPYPAIASQVIETKVR